MRVVGGMILRNGVKMDYPFREAILSALPLCEVFYVSVGQSDDGTREAVAAIGDPRILPIESVWDLNLRQGGAVLAQETNKLLDMLPKADWVLILQADEVLHEEDYSSIREAMLQWKDDERVEGLLFDYLHFYGSYEWVGASRRWYRREVRIIRPYPDIRAYKDAQGFRRSGRKLRVKYSGGRVFHYGWVRPPEAQLIKFVEMNRFWHNDEWIQRHKPERFVYSTSDRLRRYEGTHPQVMMSRIHTPLAWDFSYAPENARLTPREQLLQWIEDKTGWRPGEFRNYKLI
ncbi:MAG: glycosyltransferase family 2 protein [Bacteroidia bacterium]|nr:glycosyltransferase family 2 protein [Bacteroidia bacterium]MDW8415990.1 glycosyltransferase family 2 protein [Bacteroidia bacterium]